MNSFYRKPDQTLPEMAQEIRRITRLAYPTAPIDIRNQLGKDCFVRALNDPKIQLSIFQREPKTIDDCIRFGVEYESFTLDQKRTNNSKQGLRKITETEESDDELVTRLSKISDQIGSLAFNNNSDRIITCYYCNKKGHMKRDCRKLEWDKKHNCVISIAEKLIIPPNTEIITSGVIKGDASSIMNAMTESLPSKHTNNILIAKSSGRSKLWTNTNLEIRSSELLNEDQIKLLNDLLIKYDQTFSKNKSDLGRASAIKHTISTGNAKPIKQAPRRLPLSKRDEVNDKIQRLLDCGVIEPSKSPWASCIVPVTKKSDGSTRICIDFRPLNNITVHDSYPLIRIDDALDALRGCKWLSVMDLSSGYWQVEMDEKDKEKTAFTSTKGLFHFNVMPMGLCNGVATFQRLMEYTLAGLNWQTCLIYIDDIIVFSDSFESHLTRLGDVLDRISAQGLKVAPKKCLFFQNKVSFLGHIVSKEGIAADPGKIESVKMWPIPNNITDVRSFLGTCSYYRKFIQNFANIARPLHKLTEKNCSFEWTVECNIAFQKLKDVLWIHSTTEETILQLIVPNELKQEILEMLHDDVQSGHLGISKTTARVQNRFYWLGYKQDIIKHLQNCHVCNSRKQSPTRSRSRMKRYNVGVPLERVAMDLVGPFPLSYKGNKYALVVSDYFTKWAEGYPLPDMEAHTVVDSFIKNFICRFGIPRQIHTDQGGQFESKVFKELCEKLRIHKTRTTAFRPQSDGLVERLNRSIEDIISKYVCKNQRDWDEQLHWALMAYRSSEHETTKLSPCMLMLGREIELPIDLIYGPQRDGREITPNPHPQGMNFLLKLKQQILMFITWKHLCGKYNKKLLRKTLKLLSPLPPTPKKRKLNASTEKKDSSHLTLPDKKAAEEGKKWQRFLAPPSLFSKDKVAETIRSVRKEAVSSPTYVGSVLPYGYGCVRKQEKVVFPDGTVYS
ncbi:unnamed protein product [Mytilus edulis]|uniref:Uncharacterized protein n=1 Tax=Mytilus edulis TaxID=6550 RepID=A0A8S3R2M8_MYTED|nr:unnamed protein product [Mytilus edulis]